MHEKYYTVEEIAEMIKIHPKTVQRYIREGKLKANKVGKSWRVSGHDLSTFTEGSGASLTPRPDSEGQTSSVNDYMDIEKKIIKMSSVIDIPVPDTNEAVRISNTLTALANSKPPGYGASTLQAQYLMPENLVRVMIWGGLEFTRAILDAVSSLANGNGTDD